MNARLPTIFDDLFPDSTPEFRGIADVWPAHVVHQILTLIWEGFDSLKSLPNFRQLDFSKGYVQLERSLTDLHMDQITSLWGANASRFESFIPKHEPWEFHGLKKRSARPTSCDLGFVLVSNPRIRWTVEAKVLESSSATAEYVADLQKYLDGRSSPFSTQAALGAYLISCDSEEFFTTVATQLSCTLSRHNQFASRSHRCSEHQRPADKLSVKGMPTSFICHHLAFKLN